MIIKSSDMKFMDNFHARYYEGLYYLEESHFDLDSLVMKESRKDPFDPIVFRHINAKKFMEMEGLKNINRLTTVSYLNGKLDGIITRPEYEQFQNAEFIRQGNIKLYKTLPVFKQKQVKKIHHVIYYRENKYKNLVPIDFIEGHIESGYVRKVLACYYAYELGFGKCECERWFHKSYVEIAIPLSHILEILRNE